METNLAEKSAKYRGLPDATVRTLRALLGTLSHLTLEDIEIVLHVIEENAPSLDTLAEEDPLLTLDGVAKELGKDRTTLWRWFKKDPRMRRILGEITEQPGNPLYSKSAVRRFKSSGGGSKRKRSSRKKGA
jgi:hypothetical protein